MEFTNRCALFTIYIKCKHLVAMFKDTARRHFLLRWANIHERSSMLMHE